MDSPEPKFVALVPLEAFPVGSAQAFAVGSALVALFHTPEGLFAIDDHCTHSGGPLSEGDVRDGVVTCRWHGAAFRLATGRSSGVILCRSVERHEVRVRAGWIEVEER